MHAKLTIFVPLLALLTGCATSTPVTFQVFDAQSHPVAGAAVAVGYKTVLDFFPRGADGTTDQRGRATLPVYLNDVVGGFQVIASGYTPFYVDFSTDGRLLHISNGTATTMPGKGGDVSKGFEIRVYIEKNRQPRPPNNPALSQD